jgi:hypothetical protein
MNPGGGKSAGGSAFSVSEIIDEETGKLLETVDAAGDFGKRKQGALKTLVRIYSSWNHIPLTALSRSRLDVMGISVC